MLNKCSTCGKVCDDNEYGILNNITYCHECLLRNAAENAKRWARERLPDEEQAKVYITKEILLRLRSYESAEFTFNHAINDIGLQILDERLKLPVMQSFVHKQFAGPYENVIRVMFVMPKDGKWAETESELMPITTDMPIEDYLSLPVFEETERKDK